MTKETMIWQTLNMIVAGMVVRGEKYNTFDEFKKKVISNGLSILDYTYEDVEDVFNKLSVFGFAEELVNVYNNNKGGIK